MTGSPYRVLSILILAGLAAVLAAGCSPARVGEAAQVLADIDAGPRPSSLKAATPVPERRPVDFRVEGRSGHGDIYLPGKGDTARAAIILVPGVSPAGKDDPRLVAFATTLARARFRVLVPDLANLRELKVRPEDGRAIADAALWLSGESPEDWPLGIAAVSYAVGPAIAALGEPHAGATVDFVLAIGGYHDLTQVVTFFTTGHFRAEADESWRLRTPNSYGKWVFLESNLDRLSSAGDRAILSAIKDMRIRDRTAEVSRLAGGLEPEGRAVYDLLVNTDPERAPTLVAKLPPPLRADFAALDLSRRDLSNLPQRFFLIHGRDDPIIPETESIRLAAALPPERTRLFLVDSLDHVNPKPIGLADKLTLLDAIYGVLSLRDHGIPTSPRPSPP